MKSQKDSSNIPVTIKTDLALLKKGMADTGGEIKKLSDESEGAKSTIKLLSKILKALKKEITHLKVGFFLFFCLCRFHKDTGMKLYFVSSLLSVLSTQL